MLKVDGTGWNDTLNLPNLQQLSRLLGPSSKTIIHKILHKLGSGYIPSHSAISSDQDLSANADTSKKSITNRSFNKNKHGGMKYRPGIIRLGENYKNKVNKRRYQPIQSETPSYYSDQDSTVSQQQETMSLNEESFEKSPVGNIYTTVSSDRNRSTPHYFSE